MPSDPRAPEARAPRRRRRRWLRRVAFALVAGLLLLVVLALTRAAWLPGAIERTAPWVCRRFLGLELELERVAAADLDRLEVVGLELRAAEPGAPLKLVRAESATVRFDLRELARNGLAGLREVTARALELELDLTAPADDEAESKPFVLPPELPRLDVQGLAFTIDLPDATLSGRAIDLRSADGAAVELRSGPLRWQSPERTLEAADVRASARYEEGVVNALELSSDGQRRLSAVELDLRRIDAGILGWSGTVHTLTGSADVRGASSPEALRLTVTGRDLQLRPLRHLLPDELADLEGALSLDAAARVDLADPLRSTGRLELTGQGLRLAGREVEALDARLELGGGSLSIEELVARQGANELRAEELAFPLELTGLEDVLQRARGRIELRLLEPERLGPLPVPGLDRIASDSHLVLAARLADSVATFEKLDLDIPGARAQLERGELRLADIETPELDVALSVESDDLARALAPWQPDVLQGALSGRVDLRGRWPALEGFALLEGRDVVAAGVPLGQITLDLRADRERISARRVAATSELGELSGAGAYELATERLVDCDLRVQVRDLAELLPDVFGAGELHLLARAEGRLEELTGEVSLDAMGLVVAGGPPTGASAFLTCLGREVRLEELRVTSPFAELSASARTTLDAAWRPAAVSIESLELVSEGRPALALERPAEIGFTTEGVRLGELRLAGELGRARVAGSFGGARTELEVELDELRPIGLISAHLPTALEFERVTGALRLVADDEGLFVNTDGTLEGLRGPGLALPTNLVWRAQRARDGRTRVALDARAGDVAAARVRVRLPLATEAGELLSAGPIQVEVALDAPALELLLAAQEGVPRLAGSARVRLDLRGDRDRLDGELLLAGRRLILGDPSAGAQVGPSRLDLRAAFGERISLEVFELGTGRAAARVPVAVSGAVEAPLSLRALMSDPRDWLAATAVELRARSEIEQISQLAALLEGLGAPELPLRSGELAIEGDVSGTLAAPQLAGRMLLREGALRLGAGLPTLSRLTARIEAQPGELRLAELSGEMGGAPLSASGRVDLSGPVPRLDFSVRGDDVLVYRTRDIRARADASLTLTGTADEPVLGGRVDLTDTIYAQNFAFDVTGSGPTSGARGLQVFRFRQEPLASARLDLSVRAREAVRVRNTTIRGEVRPDLHLGGTGELPILTGAIFIEPTAVKLPGSTIVFESGTVRFREENPFVPALSLTGGARLRGYDIRVLVAGDLEQPEITLSSNPHLPNDQLLILLTTGRLPVEGDTTGNVKEAATVLATYLAGDFFARSFGGGAGDEGESVLGRFEVVSGEDISWTGAETIWVTFRVDGKEMGRGRKIYLTGERDVWDYYNYGVRFLFRFR